MFHISATLLEATVAPAPWQRVHHPKSMLPAATSHHPHPVSQGGDLCGDVQPFLLIPSGNLT